MLFIGQLVDLGVFVVNSLGKSFLAYWPSILCSALQEQDANTALGFSHGLDCGPLVPGSRRIVVYCLTPYPHL